MNWGEGYDAEKENMVNKRFKENEVRVFNKMVGDTQ